MILKGATKGGVTESDYYKDSQNSTENNTPFNVFTSGSDMPAAYKSKLMVSSTKKDDDSDSSPFLPTLNAETPDKDKNETEPIEITRMKLLVSRRSSSQNRSSGSKNEEEKLSLPSPGFKLRAVSPMSLSVNNSISSLIKGKAPSGNNRLNKLGASLNLSSRVDLIEQNKK